MSDPYATDDWKAFVAKIAAAGQDDTPRMVAADWLDEQGGEDDRAESIRVQCGLAAKPGHNHGNHIPNMGRVDCPLCSLQARERELIGGNYGGNVMGEDDPCQSLAIGVTWRRGFVAEVRIDWPGWREHGDAILDRHPVEVVTLTGRPDDLWATKRGRWVFFRPGDTDESLLKNLSASWPADPDRPRIKFDLPPVTLGQDRIGDIVRETMAELGRMRFSEISQSMRSRETLTARQYAELRERAEDDARLGHSDDRTEWMTQPGQPRTLDIRPLPYLYEIVHQCPSVRPWTLSAAAFLDDPIRPTAMYQTVSMTCRPYQLIQSGGRLLATHYFYAGRCAGCSTTFLMEARESPTRTGGTR